MTRTIITPLAHADLEATSLFFTHASNTAMKAKIKQCLHKVQMDTVKALWHVSEAT